MKKENGKFKIKLQKNGDKEMIIEKAIAKRGNSIND
jgi:hypothetical protein